MSLSNLQLRVLVALVYFPLLCLSVFDKGLFSLIALVIATLGWHEYRSFKYPLASRADWIRHVLFVFWGVFPLIAVAFNWSTLWTLCLLGLSLQVTIFAELNKGRSLEDIWSELQFYIFGMMYVTGLVLCFLFLQREPGGRVAIWFLLLIVGVSDSGAYFVGRQFGRTPFFQKLSPSKTREGFFGGLLAACLVSVLFYFVFESLNFHLPALWVCVSLGLLISLSSTVGDLIESALKRQYGVKDSGKTIPGHGGVLDRFDGVIFASLPFLFVLSSIGGFYSYSR